MTRFLAGTAALGLSAQAAVLQAVHALIAALCRLLGLAPPAPPQLVAASVTPSTIMDRYEERLEAALARDHEPVHDAGAAVHQYAAAADPWLRGAVDLGCLSPAQAHWLLSLSGDDLQRLAAAGPLACQRGFSTMAPITTPSMKTRSASSD